MARCLVSVSLCVNEGHELRVESSSLEIRPSASLRCYRDVPVAGDVINDKKLTFIIQRGSAQAIEEVRVRW